MRNGTISISVFFILFSLFGYFYIIPTQIITSIPIDKSTPAVLHPDFFPRLTIVVLGLVSLILLFSALSDTSPGIAEPDRKSALLRVAAVFALTYLFVIGLKYLGYTLVAPFFMAAIIYILGVRNWLYLMLTAFIFPVLLSYAFWWSFSVILPEGEWSELIWPWFYLVWTWFYLVWPYILVAAIVFLIWKFRVWRYLLQRN